MLRAAVWQFDLWVLLQGVVGYKQAETLLIRPQNAHVLLVYSLFRPFSPCLVLASTNFNNLLSVMS